MMNTVSTRETTANTQNVTTDVTNSTMNDGGV